MASQTKHDELEAQKHKAVSLAQARMNQVQTNEELMKSSINNLKLMIQKGFDRVPEKHRKDSPMIRAVVESTQEVIVKADDYATQWAAERVKGEVVYKQIMQLGQPTKH
jgi:hypothetical protein